MSFFLRLRRLTRTSPRLTSSQRYASSSSSSSAHTNFYKTFSRPIAKTFLIAMLTYQAAYLGWSKLEQDEIRAERQEEIKSLQNQVREQQHKNESK